MANECDSAEEVMTPIALKYREDLEWFNQRLANARIHNSELERKLAVARNLLREARDWKRKGYFVMRQRVDEFLGSQADGEGNGP